MTFRNVLNLAVTLAGIFGVTTASTNADTFGTGSNTFEINFVNVGNLGNPDDAGAGGGIYSTPYGGVPYPYRIGIYEVSQDAIDKATASGLLNVIAGAFTGSQPAARLQWYEAAAFVNWLNTSTGHHAAYDLSYLGSNNWSMNLWASADAWQAGGENRYRHKDAYYFLPSEDEWYKSAFHKNDGVTANYWDYATGSNSIPDGIDFSGDTVFEAVYIDGFDQGQPNGITNVGVVGPYGTFGQNGNAWEWIEGAFDGSNDSPSENRTARGGRWENPESNLRSSNRAGAAAPSSTGAFFGLRVASVGTAAAYEGWRVIVQNEGAVPNGNIVGGTIDTIDEAETLLANGGQVEAAGAYDTLDFANALPGSPIGTATSDFALEAAGFVDVNSGPSGTFNLVIVSSDGFRLRVNGTVIAEFAGVTPQTATHIPNVTLHDGDFIQITMFQRDGGYKLAFQQEADGSFIGSPASGISIYQVAPTVYATDFDGMTIGMTESPAAAGQDGWQRNLAVSPALGEIQSTVAISGNALHEFTSATSTPGVPTSDRRHLASPNLTANPLTTLTVDFRASSSDLSQINPFSGGLGIEGGPSPGYVILDFGIKGGNGTAKTVTGANVRLTQFDGSSNSEIPLLVGQQLAWDAWHSLTLVANQKTGRYISVTVDGQMQDLSTYHLPRSNDGGVWKRGTLMEFVTASVTPQSSGPGTQTSDSMYWDNLQITAEPIDPGRFTYEDWKESHFTPVEQINPSVSGPMADPDGDGIPNQLESFFGTEPMSPASQAGVTPERMDDPDQSFVMLTFPRARGQADTTFTIERTENLANPAGWSSQAFEIVRSIPVGGADVVTIKVKRFVPSGGGGSGGKRNDITRLTSKRNALARP